MRPTVERQAAHQQAAQDIRAALARGGLCHAVKGDGSRARVHGARMSLGQLQLYMVNKGRKLWERTYTGWQVLLWAGSSREVAIHLGVVVEVRTELTARRCYRIVVLVNGVHQYDLRATPGEVVDLRNRECSKWSDRADAVSSPGIPMDPCTRVGR